MKNRPVSGQIIFLNRIFLEYFDNGMADVLWKKMCNFLYKFSFAQNYILKVQKE